MDYNHEMSDEDFLAYVDEIVFQDIPIIESQRPELLPVDLQADVHVKADATSIAYRRWLKELGLSTGTLWLAFTAFEQPFSRRRVLAKWR